MEEIRPVSKDLRRYLALILQWAWLVLLCAFLAAATAYLLSVRSAPVYQASTLVLVNEAPSSKAVDINALQASERLAQTYAEIMVTRPVLQGVAHRLNLNVDAEALKKRFAVKPLRNTQLIQVLVEDTHPNRAAQLANALVIEFAEQNQVDQASRFAVSKQSLESELNRLDGQIQATGAALTALGVDRDAERDRLESALDQYRQSYSNLLQSYEQIRLAEVQSASSVIQKEPAVPPARPIRPRTLINTLFAGFAGLVLAVVMILLIEMLDDTVRSPDEVSRELGLPVLGVVARHMAEDAFPLSMVQPHSPVSEAFRSLRTSIQFASGERKLQSLLVSSPSPAEGKTTVAANLACLFSQDGKRTAILDANLRRPDIQQKFKLQNHAGLSELFVQPGVRLNGSLQPAGVENLWVLTSGQPPSNPAELLGSEKMALLLELLKGQFDILVIDTPPCLAVTDAAVLSTQVDGVVFVLKPGRTRLVSAKNAVESFRRAGANVFGVVLNDVEFRRSRFYPYDARDYDYSSYGTLNGGHSEGKLQSGTAGFHKSLAGFLKAFVKSSR